jgi:hypothetical protein
MKKIIIEIPDNVTETAAVDAIKRAFDPDWMASWWHIDDVVMSDPDRDDDWNSDLSEEECREVLRLSEKYHDSGIGINWEVLESWIEHVKAQRKEAA